MRERASLRRSRQRNRRKYTLTEIQPYLEMFSNRHVVAETVRVRVWFGLEGETVPDQSRGPNEAYSETETE